MNQDGLVARTFRCEPGASLEIGVLIDLTRKHLQRCLVTDYDLPADRQQPPVNRIG